MTLEEQAEQLAQAALRGWFGDPEGFKNMSKGSNRKAVRAVLKILESHSAEEQRQAAIDLQQ